MTAKVLLPSHKSVGQEAQNFRSRYLNSFGFLEKKVSPEILEVLHIVSKLPVVLFL